MALQYLEGFLDSLECLPTDLQRNFVLMKELDIKTQEYIKKIELDSCDYVNKVNDLIASEKSERFTEIHEMFEKAKVLADDKVQLAMQTYEMVDKHIRRLDTELSKLEADLKDKQVGTTTGKKITVEDTKKRGRGSSVARKQNKGSSFNPKNVIKEENEKGRKKQKANEVLTPLPIVNALLSPTVASTEVLDMPVDPNEPTYCLCHQVSYGEMIGCDNVDCPIEWFHFGCVNLTVKPKGKWFCPKCIGEKKKK